MTKDEALRLALEALEYPGPSWIEARQPAITAIKAALEAKDEPVVWNEGVPAMLPKQKEGETFIVSYEPKLEAKDEPAAWMHVQGNHEEPSFRQLDDWEIQNGWKQYPLYTTPPQRKPLTDEEIEALLVNWPKDGIAFFDFARAIEAAHGIKGEA